MYFPLRYDLGGSKWCDPDAHPGAVAQQTEGWHSTAQPAQAARRRAPGTPACFPAAGKSNLCISTPISWKAESKKMLGAEKTMQSSRRHFSARATARHLPGPLTSHGSRPSSAAPHPCGVQGRGTGIFPGTGRSLPWGAATRGPSQPFPARLALSLWKR